MKQNEHEKLTIRVNGKCVEVEDMNGITATAKCNPIDKFDIHTGINVALEHLKEAQERARFRPYVCGNCVFPHDIKVFFGYIGEETDLKDEFGEELLVGDTVKVKYKNSCYPAYYSTICKEGIKTCVMGFGSCFVRDDLILVKIPRQKKTEWCTLIETYDEMKGESWIF